MKRTICCPKCKNLDLIIPDNINEEVVCPKCEYSFLSLDCLKAKKIVLNKIFTISLIIFIITLVLGTMLFFLPVYGEYDLPTQEFLIKLDKIGLVESKLVGIGIGFYILALITMISIFISAYYSHHYHERRMYLRKHGYIYEKREKRGYYSN